MSLNLGKTFQNFLNLTTDQSADGHKTFQKVTVSPGGAFPIGFSVVGQAGATSNDPRTEWAFGAVQTSDATLTQAILIPMDNGDMHNVEIVVSARETTGSGGNDAAAYLRHGSWRKTAAGVVTNIGFTAISTHETVAAWAVQQAVGSGRWAVNVQGTVGKTVNWHVFVRVHPVEP